MGLTASEIAKAEKKIRQLVNQAKYKQAIAYVRKLRKICPKEILFIYYESVLHGDDEKGRSQKQVLERHKRTSKRLKPLLQKLRGLPPGLRHRIRNEYYWFAHLPRKQFLLGCESVARGQLNGYYSKGVGAVELSRQYAEKGRIALKLKWARKAEIAWRQFFKHRANWYNSYCWYAKSLAYQGKLNRKIGRAIVKKYPNLYVVVRF